MPIMIRVAHQDNVFRELATNFLDKSNKVIRIAISNIQANCMHTGNGIC